MRGDEETIELIFHVKTNNVWMAAVSETGELNSGDAVIARMAEDRRLDAPQEYLDICASVFDTAVQRTLTASDEFVVPNVCLLYPDQNDLVPVTSARYVLFGTGGVASTDEIISSFIEPAATRISEPRIFEHSTEMGESIIIEQEFSMEPEESDDGTGNTGLTDEHPLGSSLIVLWPEVLPGAALIQEATFAQVMGVDLYRQDCLDLAKGVVIGLE